MSEIYLLNKPFNVLSSFTDPEGRDTLATCIKAPGVYAAGRLDYDSEGLLLLTADGALIQRIADPRFKLEKRYWAQLEGDIDEQALEQLRRGVTLKDGRTRPAFAQRLAEPQVWERNPPIRERKNQPTSWIELGISEGKNRQVRRMTAAVGFPTLRLIRVSIGPWHIDDLKPGQWRKEQINLPNGGKPKTARSPKRRSRS